MFRLGCPKEHEMLFFFDGRSLWDVLFMVLSRVASFVGCFVHGVKKYHVFCPAPNRNTLPVKAVLIYLTT